jgi:2-dehydropantoate 2-reductase
MKYLKIFVNANNCIPAILGTSMQEAFSNIEVSRISMGIWREGLEIIKKAGINLVSLPDFPLERLIKLTSLPIYEAAKIYSGIMMNLSKEPIYGSILQSIKRGKPSEIDYINGEFVNIARQNNLEAPLNARLVEMVHQVEETGKFFSKEELISEVKI